MIANQALIDELVGRVKAGEMTRRDALREAEHRGYTGLTWWLLNMALAPYRNAGQGVRDAGE